MRAMASMKSRRALQSATVGMEVGGGAGRTQLGVPMVDVKGARRSRRWRACGRIAYEAMQGEGVGVLIRALEA